jgi:hypothetical protein
LAINYRHSYQWRIRNKLAVAETQEIVVVVSHYLMSLLAKSWRGGGAEVVGSSVGGFGRRLWRWLWLAVGPLAADPVEAGKVFN